MRPQVILDEASGEIWPANFDLTSQKTSSKLLPVLEVIGTGSPQSAALSCHCSYLATVTRGEDALNRLFIINMTEKRFYLLKRLIEPCTALLFHPYQENTLFLATASCKVYSINVDDDSVIVMEGHTLPVERIQSGLRSPLVVTHNDREVLLWSWPSVVLTSKMRHDDRLKVIWAGHVWQRDELVVSFISGSILIWPSHKRNTQVHIEAPKGLDFDFKAFALSRGGEWLVGGGKSHLLVTYSLVSRSVTQVVQLPTSCSDIFQPVFLPPVHPNYSQVLALLNSTGMLNIIDFATATKLKTIRSQRFNIEKEEIAFRIVEKREKVEREEEIRRRERREKSQELQELLDKNKWYKILQEFKAYPEKYRTLIWLSVLEVPRNYSVFSSLLDKGTHTAFEGLQEVLELPDGALFRALQGTLSCLTHWAPFLASVDYLPEFVFPFIKMFHSNPLLCFEVTLTIIMNWCCLWFEFWPEPGITVLNVIEQIISVADPSLLTHLIKLKVTAEDYAWSLLTSAFSKVLSSSDWLVLWDHILSNHPSFLPCVAAAFTIKSRQTILTCSDSSEIKMYYYQESWITVRSVLDKAYVLHSRLSEMHLPKNIFEAFTPMPRDGLPLFNIGPRDTRDEEIENMERNVCKLHLCTKSPGRSVARNSVPDTVHRKQQEEMVYFVGQNELQKQEDECLESILSLRKRHLASTLPENSNCNDSSA
ncbi:TBC1 domain family member 31 isoform X3 [Cherax quadricarinatus]|uniref:TBC1 domain family member 31 isoform X3 n=1 Tax=Cherax quadricarinatus TaxID=27406 RepID=UPI0023785FEF|nr:TBC1 domain family member 31-like isoform X3 [Cherax quadricarinatus]